MSVRIAYLGEIESAEGRLEKVMAREVRRQRLQAVEVDRLGAGPRGSQRPGTAERKELASCQHGHDRRQARNDGQRALPQ
jgi:hypothetical protein